MSETLPGRGSLTMWHPASRDPPINEQDNRFWLRVCAFLLIVGALFVIVAILT